MATLEGFKDSVDRRIVALFQPHLYSRTRDLYEKFGKSFFSCDCLILAPIYPAREQAIPGVSSQMIADVAIQSGHRAVHVIENNAQIIPQTLALLKPGDLFITMGAGNIWQYGEEILYELKKSVDTITKAQKSSNL
jgi:UDP-N-acetylmuramate--alanine ligase